MVDITNLTDDELIYLSFLIEKEILRRIQCNGGEIEEKEQKKENN